MCKRKSSQQSRSVIGVIFSGFVTDFFYKQQFSNLLLSTATKCIIIINHLSLLSLQIIKISRKFIRYRANAFCHDVIVELYDVMR